MPGIFGLLTSDPAAARAALVSAALGRMRAYSWHRSESLEIAAAGVTLGRAVSGDLASASHPFSAADPRAVDARNDQVVVAVDGELYDTSRPAAEVLLDGYRADGQAFLAGVRGSFTAVIWDGRTRQLVVTNDRFGTRPVYWTASPGRFCFASEIKALLADDTVPRAWSSRGLAQFFAFGQFFGDDTFFDAIRALPPAAWLVCDQASGRVVLDRYLSPAPLAVAGDDEGQLDEIERRFVDAVRCRTADDDGLGLSLSGGLDARTILGVVPDGTALSTVSLGIHGSIDHRSAARLSALTGRSHHALMLDEAFLENFEPHLREMVRLTDGHYLDQGLVMTTLPKYRELGIRTLLRGHAGELMHMDKAYAFSVDAQALSVRDENELVAWLMPHLSGYMRGEVDGPLFKSVLGDANQLASASLREALAASAGVEPPAQRIWHVFVGERLHRETALSMHQFRSFVDVRMPYLDEALTPLLLAVPPRMKLGDRIQSHILRRHRPAFLGVVNANTGTRMGAGPWRTRASRLRLRVYSKLGVPGYQPYERLGLWLRRELRPMVDRLLLADSFLEGGPFRPEAVRRVIEQHGRAERNHTFLLMAMVVFSLGVAAEDTGPVSPTR